MRSTSYSLEGTNHGCSKWVQFYYKRSDNQFVLCPLEYRILDDMYSGDVVTRQVRLLWLGIFNSYNKYWTKVASKHALTIALYFTSTEDHETTCCLLDF